MINQKARATLFSVCKYAMHILSTLSALNSIENYYNHIEFRMYSMHIGTQAWDFFYNDKYRLLPPTGTDSDASVKTYVLVGHCLCLKAQRFGPDVLNAR